VKFNRKERKGFYLTTEHTEHTEEKIFEDPSAKIRLICVYLRPLSSVEIRAKSVKSVELSPLRVP
jgi:hypothetical protein